MRIKKIEITKLFGVFNYSIPLNLGDHITILHGANGVGKTTILQMLHALFNNEETTLQRIPFNKFCITLDDGQEILVKKTKTSKSAEARLKIHYQKHSYEVQPLSDSQDLLSTVHSIEREIPSLRRTGHDTWHYLPTQENLSLEEVFDSFGQTLPSIRYHLEQARPQWLKSLQEEFSVLFIQVQRLLSRQYTKDRRGIPGESMVSSLQLYSQELVGTIRSALAGYADLSHTLDLNFPIRLLSHTPVETLSVEGLRDRFAELEKHRTRLIHTGLLDKKDDLHLHLPDDIKGNTRYVLSLYVEDALKKLSVLKELSERIESFTSIVNSLYNYKQIEINKERGFVFKTTSGEFLSPSALSSGEQHELVLLYELLFKTERDSLILIDEPEVSLHVLWQEEFLEHLQQITHLIHCDAIIATHSPEIINDRWDLTIGLAGEGA